VLDYQCFLRCNHECRYFAIVETCRSVRNFTTADPYVQVPHIRTYEMTDGNVLIKPSEIVQMNIIMFVDDEIFIAELGRATSDVRNHFFKKKLIRSRSGVYIKRTSLVR